MNNPLEKMNSEQIELYKQIQSFLFDQPDAQFSFSKRLARDNRWSLHYAHRVIEEYRKFVFLAVVAEHPVTPSDQVDQVWHLHLSYTRSYWQEFCPKILQISLHHDPSRGGPSEQSKFDDWYSRTLESYKQFFGQLPPLDIWSSPKDRFERDLHFVRVNTRQTWLVPKPCLNCLASMQHKPVVIVFLLITLATTVTDNHMVSYISNPLNFRNLEFPIFFSFSIIVIFLVFLFRSYLQLLDSKLIQPNASLDTHEAAYLTEGKDRAVDI